MKNSRMYKVLTAMAALVLTLALLSATAFAATTDIVKDGEFQNVGFINAGEAVEGTIQGPGNWTQLNCGDAAVDTPYLHIIIKATGDTAPAQIGVSDLFTFNLTDLGITLTEEYQDVVLPVEEKGITILSWVNFMGLDGGSSVYTIKDVFLSDDAAPTIAAEPAPAEEAVVEEAAEVTADAEVPQTGSSDTVLIIAFIGMACSALLFAGLKRNKKVSA